MGRRQTASNKAQGETVLPLEAQEVFII